MCRVLTRVQTAPRHLLKEIMLFYALKAWSLFLRTEEMHEQILHLRAKLHLLWEVHPLAEGHDVGVCLCCGVPLKGRDTHKELVANDA